jgi:NADH dehydrogenase (ubiquinone) 1 alpha subcomplex subunit 6
MSRKIIRFQPAVFSPSKDLKEANWKAKNLFKKTLQAVPSLISLYQLDLHPKDIRKKIREDFNKQRGVKDPRVIDMLVFRTENELYDALQLYKTKHHVHSTLNPIHDSQAV